MMRRLSWPLLLLAGCGGPTIPGTVGGPQGGGDGTAGDDGTGLGDTGVEVLPGAAGPWLRERVESPGPVTFNELHYHPIDGQGGEWIELHNPLVLDVDLGGWRLSGAVELELPRGTRIPAGGFLVVAADPDALRAAGGPGDALGPWDGSLSNQGERVELISNGGRRIDSVGYRDVSPWPVPPDGSGATLAKVHVDLASDTAEHWTHSLEVGGTPGADNGLDPAPASRLDRLVGESASWAVDASGEVPPADWAGLAHDDSTWELGTAPFLAGDEPPDATVRFAFTADNYHALFLGQADGSGMRAVGADSDGYWGTVETLETVVSAGEHLYVAAWELTGDSGSTQMMVGEVRGPDGDVGTHEDEWSWVLGPVGANPGVLPGAAGPTVGEIADAVADAEAAGAWSAPGAALPVSASPWGAQLASALPLARFLWADTFDPASLTNTDDTYALFRLDAPVLGAAANIDLDEVPVQVRFRTRFAFAGDPERVRLRLSCRFDDGGLVFLNGDEVLRHALPTGVVGPDTPATVDVDAPTEVVAEIDGGALREGENVLAVAVHQADVDDVDLFMDCTLVARVPAEPIAPGVWFDEVPAARGDDGVELRNAGEVDVELETLVIWTSGGDRLEVGSGTLRPGDRVQVDGLVSALTLGDRLFLGTGDGASVLDGVRIEAHAQARDAAGVWRVPEAPTPGGPNRVSLEDGVVINELHYHPHPVSEPGVAFAEREEEWLELFNRSDTDVDLSGWTLEDGVAFSFPDGTVLDAGGFLVVARDAAATRAAHPDAIVVGDFRGRLGDGGERVVLRDANGNTADSVSYADGGRWPSLPDGGGASLELRDPWADNSVPEAWAASDETHGGQWTRVEIQGVAEPSAVGPDGRWDELVFGLLDAGEVLIDDVSVVEDPDGEAVELVPDGGFDDGGAAWQWLGTHRHGGVGPDPDDPSNPVLRVVATGATGHMHNHVLTTLDGPVGRQEYRISFRARWVSGSNQLHSRLYFNRLPRTTLLPQPALVGTPGRPNSRLTDTLGPTGDALRTDPVVPEPGEPVTVTVRLSDPDGVAAATLWASVDGGPFFDTPLERTGEGEHRATLPGQGAGAVVHFFVESEDATGAVSTLPAGGPDSRALYGVDAGEGPTTGLHDLRILMTPEDVAWLHDPANLMSDDRLGATVVYNGAQVFHDVGVRLKGSQRGRPTQPRVGYALRFPDDNPFRGSHGSVMIDRSEGVGYGQREILHNVVMTLAGSPSGEFNDLVQLQAPWSGASGPAELQLDRFSGLVLDAQFSDGSEGMRYEYELVYYPLTTDDGTPTGAKLPQPDRVVGTPITDLGPDKEAYRQVFLVKNNPRRDDFDDLMAACGVFAASDEAFLLRAPDVIDVDQWLRAYAMSTLSGATDQYGGAGSQHNVQFYVRPEDGRLLHFPHDLDFYSSSQMPVIGNSDLARLLQDPLHERAYYAHLDDLLRTAYDPDVLGPWCDQLAVLLPAQDFRGHCAFVGARSDWIRSGSPDSVESRYPVVDFAITTNGGADLEVDTDELQLEGAGWLDVATIEVGGRVQVPVWLDDTTWSVTVALQTGENVLQFRALDRHGDEVGRDRIVVVNGAG